MDGTTVSVVDSRLSRPESYYQVFDALATLNNTFTEVMSKIDQRVTVERSRILNISTRLEKTQAKVNQLSFHSEAVVVMSPSRLPIEPQSFYEPVLSQVEPVVVRSNYQVEAPLVSDPLPIEAPSFKSKTRRFELEEDEADGLGCVPHQVTSVSDLLLFNTRHSPYQKYRRLNNLDVDESREVRKPEGHKVELTCIPPTLLKGDKPTEFPSMAIPYVPWHRNSDVPQIPFVADLPLRNLFRLREELPQGKWISPSLLPDDLPDIILPVMDSAPESPPPLTDIGEIEAPPLPPRDRVCTVMTLDDNHEPPIQENDSPQLIYSAPIPEPLLPSDPPSPKTRRRRSPLSRTPDAADGRSRLDPHDVQLDDIQDHLRKIREGISLRPVNRSPPTRSVVTIQSILDDAIRIRRTQLGLDNRRFQPSSNEFLPDRDEREWDENG
eukprot:TRINITY_DN5065_c0_g2_i1.p1 TRINITY_DN5065_c0_g2~~TRINITY_DN5065_c0_g2_i1.p1  ORF type:complete len:438 (+),score=66.78 TRINITY_DN5065_c0_g2_i1:64-1377(+)